VGRRNREEIFGRCSRSYALLATIYWDSSVDCFKRHLRVEALVDSLAQVISRVMPRRVMLDLTTTLLCIGILRAQDTVSIVYQPASGNYLIRYASDGRFDSTTFVPATKIEPVVRCRVATKGLRGPYTYLYTVSLHPSSHQCLCSFAVSHSAPLQSAGKPNSGWRMREVNGAGAWRWLNSRKDTSGLWTPTTDLVPGGSLSGISLTSQGLPAIVNSYSAGNAPRLMFGEEPPFMVNQFLDSVNAFPNNTVTRCTIGPNNPPLPFRPSAFLDTLISYTTRSLSLGWIIGQPTADKYINFFRTSRASLERADVLGAVNILRDVISSANADSGSSLTSEAYALIRYNTEYLVSRLQEKR